ncbi:hypothetical protein [Haloplanus halophilus]|uniref:hypothetical protein n=1 Tax=Haloplanus halophilus TaxID=2949993 RepID=UPI0020422D73|nr:hypothetical protein [Haloplanus sp. GDY1]
MDSDERRRRVLRHLCPWIGLVAATGALTLGIRAIAAGSAGSGAVGYLAGGLELAAGYVTARRAWTRTVDAVLVAGVVAIVALSAFVLTQLQLPPTVFQEMAGG